MTWSSPPPFGAGGRLRRGSRSSIKDFEDDFVLAYARISRPRSSRGQAFRGNDEASARSYALRLLKFRPRSEEELRRRLGRKGVEAPVQEAVIAELRRKGLVDDEKFARYYATQAVLSKPQGRRALLHGLKARGIDPQIAGETVALATKDQDELETARRLALQRLSRLKGLDVQTVRRRLFGLLSRRGFSSDVVYRVVREISATGHFEPV